MWFISSLLGWWRQGPPTANEEIPLRDLEEARGDLEEARAEERFKRDLEKALKKDDPFSLPANFGESNSLAVFAAVVHRRVCVPTSTPPVGETSHLLSVNNVENHGSAASFIAGRLSLSRNDQIAMVAILALSLFGAYIYFPSSVATAVNITGWVEYLVELLAAANWGPAGNWLRVFLWGLLKYPVEYGLKYLLISSGVFSNFLADILILNNTYKLIGSLKHCLPDEIKLMGKKNLLWSFLPAILFAFGAVAPFTILALASDQVTSLKKFLAFASGVINLGILTVPVQGLLTEQFPSHCALFLDQTRGVLSPIQVEGLSSVQVKLFDIIYRSALNIIQKSHTEGGEVVYRRYKEKCQALRGAGDGSAKQVALLNLFNFLIEKSENPLPVEISKTRRGIITSIMATSWVALGAYVLTTFFSLDKDLGVSNKPIAYAISSLVSFLTCGSFAGFMRGSLRGLEGRLDANKPNSIVEEHSLLTRALEKFFLGTGLFSGASCAAAAIHVVQHFTDDPLAPVTPALFALFCAGCVNGFYAGDSVEGLAQGFFAQWGSKSVKEQLALEREINDICDLGRGLQLGNFYGLAGELFKPSGSGTSQEAKLLALGLKSDEVAVYLQHAKGSS